MSDLLPIPALPPAPVEPAARLDRWWRFLHPRAARQARVLAAHHAWTTDRARCAQIALVRDGYHLGPIPYGYLPLRVPPSDATPGRRTRLATDPERAWVVATIYEWRIADRLPTRTITARLRGSADLVPVDVDAAGFPRPWTAAAVTRLLANPVYTGVTVWGRTRGGQPVPPAEWILGPNAHQPIIDTRTFFLAQQVAPPDAGAFDAAFARAALRRMGDTDAAGGWWEGLA
jgi:hypothetical protein